MILYIFISLITAIIESPTWFQNSKFTKFGKIVCIFFIDIIYIIGGIFLIPFVLLEIIIGSIIWAIQFLFYKKKYRKSFTEIFGLNNEDIELK